MKTRIILFAFIVILFPLIHLFASTDKQQPITQMSSGLRHNTDNPESGLTNSSFRIKDIDQATIKADKELVVVSKTPEIFSYTLAGISALLSVITILIGLITGIGLTIIIRVNKEKEAIENARNNLKNDYKKMLETLKLTSTKLIKVDQAKRKLRDTLSQSVPSSKEVYLLIQKTVRYPDAECLELYAKALESFEADINIIRVIRNGLLEFSRNPEKV